MGYSTNYWVRTQDSHLFSSFYLESLVHVLVGHMSTFRCEQSQITPEPSTLSPEFPGARSVPALCNRLGRVSECLRCGVR